MTHRVSVIFDRADGSNIEVSKATIEKAIALLEPLKDELRLRVTRSDASLVEDKAWRDS
jgi:hypothetical protein